MKKMNLQGTKTNIMLRTMGQERVVESQILPELEVSKLDDKFFDLPETFTQETIPVSRAISLLNETLKGGNTWKESVSQN